MDIKLDSVPPWLINFISRQLIGSGHKLYQKAVSTVATCDEDYKKALRAPLYARIREYQCPADKPAEHEHQVEDKPFISPEVEQALGILDNAIAILQSNKTGNIGALQKFLGYAASSEGSAAGLRISETDNLPNGYLVTTPPQDSRETRHAYSLPKEEDAFDNDSPKNTTASAVANTKSMTLRSTIKVHEEESLNTNRLRQNGFHIEKGPKRGRKAKRWLCCLTPSTI
ncbi:hypothetical protein BRADI_4g08310v3 [Brachypodium distachyon]|uniref:Uncharacterized protein n=1 Tax=Brachypodium distachyon TaxID=15368 RepID=A0A2K2CL91_BRADI|nr:hypothetical protein BRADI_4g08310v3 [Brachypodium distachyon]